MGYKLGKNSLKNLEDVHPSLVAVVKRAIQITEQDFAVTDGRRTQAQQDELYAQGRTKPGPIVTWTKKSKHLTGRAVDLAPYIDGKIVWEPLSAFDRIDEAMQAAGRELGVPIEWGGRWKTTKDRPHFQLPDGWEPASEAPRPLPGPLPPIPEATHVSHPPKGGGQKAGLVAAIIAILGAILSKVFGLW